METDNSNELGAGANVDSIDSVHVTYLPLVDYEGKLLPVHFLSAEEVGISSLQGFFRCFIWIM